MRCPAAERQNTMFIVCYHPNFYGRTRRGHTGRRPHRSFFSPSFCGACLNFLIARGIQPFISLVDREVEFCVPTTESFSTCWAWCERKTQFVRLRRDSNSRPNVIRFRAYQLNHRGDRELGQRLLKSLNPVRYFAPR